MAAKKKIAKPAKRKHQFNDRYYVQSHELARSGMSVIQIAKALGVPVKIFSGWVKTRPALAEAIDSARSPSSRPNGDSHRAGETFLDYVYKQLPHDLQVLWQEIEALDEEAHRPVRERGTSTFQRDFYPDRIDRLFTNTGIKRARQSLWVHALVNSNFNANEACRKVNISRQAVEEWRRTEPDFELLIDKHIEIMKKDFGESCLFRKMHEGDSSAIIFFNATKNADRGYVKPDKNIRISGKVNVLTTAVDANRLLDQLSLADRVRMLENLEREQNPKIVEALPEHAPSVSSGSH